MYLLPMAISLGFFKSSTFFFISTSPTYFSLETPSQLGLSSQRVFRQNVWQRGVEKFNLVGFFYGSMVGFKLAQLYPNMVNSMVISSSSMELTESISNAIFKNIGFTNWPDFLLPKTLSQVKVLLALGTHKAPWFPDFLYRDFFEVIFRNPKEKEELVEASVVSERLLTLNYSQRIYILCGEDDKIFNKPVIDAMKEKLGETAILEFVKGAGHLVQIERPCFYNRRSN